MARLMQQLLQPQGVLEACVHTLPVKGNRSVHRIPQANKLVLVVPGVARDRKQRRGRVREEVFEHRWHECKVVCGDIWKVFLEERNDIILRLELVEVLERHEEGAREGAVQVGQPDEHELVPGPDVQRLGGHRVVAPPRAVLDGGDGELLVPVLDVLALKVEPHEPPELLTHLGKGAVGPDDKVASNLLGSKQGQTRRLGYPPKLGAKGDGDVLHALQLLQKDSVELLAGNRVDRHAGAVLVRLKHCCQAVLHTCRVNHPPLHRHGLRHHLVFEAGGTECAQATVRESEVDGSLCGVGELPVEGRVCSIASFRAVVLSQLENLDRVPVPCQQDPRHAPHEAPTHHYRRLSFSSRHRG
mmetsp:Transcript_34449/g.80744  ORF Transcript_34449/g.80744 Transcript_34449/m.80744 type:complete len:357 (+) Transcript_34449:92-1162(+)